MITFKQFIVETIEQPVDWKWIQKYKDQWTAYFEINSIQYHVVIGQDDEITTMWDMVFTTVNLPISKGMFDLTGTGNAFIVFSTVKQVIGNFINKNPQVQTLVFTAQGESRKKFYDRWSKQIAQSIGNWHVRIIDKSVRKYVLSKPQS
jgi:hypothetical protein